MTELAFWCRTTHTLRYRVHGSILIVLGIRVDQLWPFVHKPVLVFPYAFAFILQEFVSKVKFCNLNRGLPQIAHGNNFGAKGLISCEAEIS